jgi:hypothetical protein
MALPRSHQNAFTPSEVEFIASNGLIKIIPYKRFDRLDLIQVELFMSTHLKRVFA